MLKHCATCERTTAFVDGKCQRCAFLKANRKKTSRPMRPETKARLRALRAWRRGEPGAIDPRQKGTT